MNAYVVLSVGDSPQTAEPVFASADPAVVKTVMDAMQKRVTAALEVPRTPAKRKVWGIVEDMAAIEQESV